MNPKTLQSLLGHSDIKMTFEIYVHAQEEQKEKEMQEFVMTGTDMFDLTAKQK